MRLHRERFGGLVDYFNVKLRVRLYLRHLRLFYLIKLMNANDQIIRRGQIMSESELRLHGFRPDELFDHLHIWQLVLISF